MPNHIMYTGSYTVDDGSTNYLSDEEFFYALLKNFFEYSVLVNAPHYSIINPLNP